MTGRISSALRDLWVAVQTFGIMFVWQTALGRLTVQSDSDWAGDKGTRKRVSAETFVMFDICFALGAKTRQSLQ